MSTIILRKNNCEHFKNLISSSNYDLIGTPGILAMGSVNPKNQAVGAIVCRFNATTTLQVLWLYVDEAFRGQGYGSELYQNLMRATRDSYEKIICIFEDCAKYDDVLFFMMSQKNTTFIPVTDDLVTVNVQRLFDKVTAMCKTNNNISRLESIPSFLIKSEMQNMTNDELKKNAPLLESPLNISLYMEGSCGIVDNNVIKGFLLCKKTNHQDKYAVTFFDNKYSSPVPILQMLKFTASELVKKAADSMLTICTLNGFGKAVSEITNNSQTPMVLTCAVTNLK